MGPFMGSHTWADYPRGKWTLEVRFNGERVNHGFLKEWTLMLHGTRDPPYSDLPVTDPHSKLAIVKKAHDEKKMGGGGAALRRRTDQKASQRERYQLPTTEAALRRG